MGAIIPQVITESKASGAQVIDGSLKFHGPSKNYLTRTPSGAGNRRTFTLSYWIKEFGRGVSPYTNPNILWSGSAVETRGGMVHRGTSGTDQDRIYMFNQVSNSTNSAVWTNSKHRDFSGWKHVVFKVDSTQSTGTDRVKIYINGVEQEDEYKTTPTQNLEFQINIAQEHRIGRGIPDDYGNFSLSQYYFIDGQALAPSYFGFTDPLTNTWRPKKLRQGDPTVNDGTQWSSYITNSSGASNLFDGDLSTTYGPDGNTQTWTPPKPIEVATSIRIYYSSGVTSRNFEVNDNGNVVATGTGTKWVDLNFTGSLSKLSGTNGWNVRAIEIDGVVLVDSTITTVDFSTNGFHLPMDGNSPIGDDKSGKGNNWTPVNFGGSVALGNPIVSGALPILNTDGGGNVARVGVRTDAYHANLALALPLVGNANDTSNSVNSGSTTKTITVTNAFASSIQSNFYNGSFYFDGSGDYLNAASSSDFGFGTGAFTVEAWIYPTALTSAAHYLFAFSSDDAVIGYNQTSGSLNIQLRASGSPTITTYGRNVVVDKWQHYAVTRDGSGNVRAYLDGILSATVTDSTDMGSSGTCSIGNRIGLSREVIGYIQDARVYKGVAKYTSNFVVPVTSPDILPDTPSGVSGGSKLTKVTDGAVSFDGTDDFLKISGSSDFDFGTSDFTVECFVYFNNLSNNQGVLDTRSGSNTNGFALLGRSNGTVSMADGTSLIGAAISVSSSRWMHLAASRSGSSLKFFVDGVLSSTVTNSTDFSNDDFIIGTIGGGTEDLNGFTSNVRVLKGTALYTANFTPPSAPLTNVTNTKLLCCQSNTSATAGAVIPNDSAELNAPLSSVAFADSSTRSKTITNVGSITTASAGSNTFNITNAASFDGSSKRLNTPQTGMTFTGSYTLDTYIKLDSSASNNNMIINTGYRSGSDQYIYIGVNSSDKLFYEEVGTTGNRTTASDAISKNTWYHIRVTQGDGNVKLYANGTLQVTHPNNTVSKVTGRNFTIGAPFDNANNSNNFHGLIGPTRYAATNLGAPSAGGEATTGGALSNLSFAFSITANGNAAATNFNPFNTDINTVRGQETGYATLNPLSSSGDYTFADGNLKVVDGSGGEHVRAPFGVTSGKWYWEANFVSQTSANDSSYLSVISDTGVHFGIRNRTADIQYYSSGGGNLGTYSSSNWSTSDTYSLALDLTTNQLKIYTNNILGATVSVTANLEYFASYFRDGSDASFIFNFGQKPFKFPPPDGFQSLNAANVRPETVIARPDQYVAASIWTGDGTENRLIPLNMKPDLIWIKQRNDTRVHILQDSVRGFTKGLYSNDTDTESTRDPGYGEAVFGGFEVSNGAGSNVSSRTMVAWNWKAGGNKNTFNVDDVGYASAAAAGLTGGTITPTGASVGTKQGFSIVSYTSESGTGTLTATIPHGLNESIGFMIIKSRDFQPSSQGWAVWHQSSPTAIRYLDTTAEFLNSEYTAFIDANPTNSVFSVKCTASVSSGNRYRTYGNSHDYIAYLWHDVPGLQQFGSYEGNGDADGPFIELGFRPAVVLTKNVDAADDWSIADSSRSPHNVAGESLRPNSDAQEDSSADIDILSNGFKIRQGNSHRINYDAETFIYAAWAEAPTFNLYGGQSNAR